MTAVNQALTALTDALIGPLASISAGFALIVLSLLTAVLVLAAFKWTGDQRALAATKRSIHAAIFEMRLFNDDLRALLRAQADVLRHTGHYVRLSLGPTLWVILPILVLMVHMEFYFGYTGLPAGEASLVKVTLDPDAPPSTAEAASLETPAVVRVETPAVWLPSAREIVWRVNPREPGSYDLRVRLRDQVLTKRLEVSDAPVRRSPVRPAADLRAQLLHPSEPPLPSESGVRTIVIPYPSRAFDVVGWSVSWVYLYLGLTLVFAVALRGPFRVTI